MNDILLTPIRLDELETLIQNSVRKVLNENPSSSSQDPSDQLLTIQETAELLHLSVPTVYGLVHRKIVPVCKKGKRLYFPKKELIEWIKSGRKKTEAELTDEAVAGFRNANKKK